MNIAVRRAKILSMIEEREFVSVEELAGILGVTKVTIRSDLRELEASGGVVRTHGGATIPERQSVGRRILTTMKEYKAEKMKIAEAASSLVVPGNTVIVDSGSTTVHVVKHLFGKNVTMVTGSVMAVLEVSEEDNMEVVMFGGMLRRFSMGTIGGFADSNLAQIHADIYFMGTTSYDEGEIYSSNLIEAQTKRRMMASSDRICLLADSSKAGEKAFASVCSWEDVDYFVTDAISDDFKAALEEKGVVVIIA